jgi:hypothetical protein
MFWLHFAALLCGGALAASGFIIARKPEAKDLLGKLAPYQGGIGVAMLASGVWNLIDGTFGIALKAMEYSMLLGLTLLSMVLCELLVGFLLGFGLIAAWIPGEGAAEVKMLNLQKKLATISAPLGLVAMATAVLALLYQLKILSP